MAPWNIDERFDSDVNADVLRFLRAATPSAHSDVAEELIRAASGLSGVQHYCPDPARYAFVVLHRQDFTIIGLAFGQSALAFRLAAGRVPEALRDGGTAVRELGEGWVRFEPWSNEETLVESRARLGRWCRAAAMEREGS